MNRVLEYLELVVILKYFWERILTRMHKTNFKTCMMLAFLMTLIFY